MELKSTCDVCVDDSNKQFEAKELVDNLCPCEPIDDNTGIIYKVPVSRIGYEINDCLRNMLFSMTTEKFCGSPPRCKQ